MEKINKKEVSTLLQMLANTAERPLDKEGKLDVKAFNELRKVKLVKEKIKAMGVDKKWLFNNGFMTAGMILII